MQCFKGVTTITSLNSHTTERVKTRFTWLTAVNPLKGQSWPSLKIDVEL